MINLSKYKLREIRLKTGWISPVGEAPTPDVPDVPTPPEPEVPIPGLEGLVALYNAYGLTNEEMKENPVWKDLSGNGNDVELKNFAWQGESGVGMYNTNMNNFTGGFTAGASFEKSVYSLTINMPMNSTATIFAVYPEGTNINVRYKIQDLGDTKLTIQYGSENHSVVITKDGIYDFELDYTKRGNFYFMCDNTNGAKDETITIQSLPYAYENALVFDGVDDYGINVDFPVFTKEKGYTVMALRKWLTVGVKEYSNLVTNSKSWSNSGNAFIVDYYNRPYYLAASFGGTTIVRSIPELITYQTSNEYNEAKISTGNSIGTNILVLSGSAKEGLMYYSNFALYSLAILDHNSTPEERQLIIDYWKKYYGDMIEYDQFDPTKPSYAWTVKGKTNGDLDRNIVKELRGTGNDLRLTNFAFTEESGYNADGYLVTDGVDDKIESITPLDEIAPYTILGNWFIYKKKQIGSSNVIMMTENLGIYDRKGGIGIRLKGISGKEALIPNVISIKALNTEGKAYDSDWNEYKIEQVSNNLIDRLEIGSYTEIDSTFVSFKNLAIYPGALTKPQCQKAYDWLQEQVAPKDNYGGIAIDGAPNGVYILATDNKLYTSDKWNTARNWAAVGVAVMSDEARFVISPEESAEDMRWGGYGTLIDSILTTDDKIAAVTDYLGSDNTDKIIAQLGEGNAPAAEYCRGVIFKNGKKGYLPALGEFGVANNNKAEIDTYISLIGGTPINLDRFCCTSTQRSDIEIWVLSWKNDNIDHIHKNNIIAIRAFAPLT